jgi:sarcosine oxidase
LTVPRETEVVVVGLGVLGLATLHALAGDGVDAVGVERFRTGHAEGSSHGRSRALRFLYHAPEYADLLHAALHSWTELERATNRRLYWPCGTLFFGRPGNAHLARTVPIATAQGHEIHPVDEQEAARRWPAFALPAGAEGVFLPRGGMLDADACVGAFQLEAERLGATIVQQAPVTSLELGDERPTVRTSAGDIRARHVVIAAGAWTTRLLPALGLSVRVTRQGFYTFHPADPAAVGPDRLPVWADVDTSDYGFPDHGPGLKVANEVPGPEVDPDHVDRAADQTEERRLGDVMRARFPTTDLTQVEAGTCLYTVTPDDDFLLGPVPGASASLVVGLGHAFKFAPVIGRVLADLATTGRSRHPIGRFRLDRFAHATPG